MKRHAVSRFKRTFFILLAFSFLFPAFVQAVKPRPPIQLMFQETMLSKTETEITLTARSNIETASVLLTLTLPSDQLFIEGEMEWEGPMSTGAEQIIRVIILKPAVNGAVIEGQATIRLPNETIFEQNNRLVLKESSQKSSKSIPPMKHKGNHESILEFR